MLDASGSMWGQIDGTAKIEIAQSVVGDLLTTLDLDQALWLTVYGHRVKGDCSDIETLVLPGADTRAAIAAAVNAISPKGKTPLSDAVIQAAEALKYTEEAATVILVTDGLETCERDPCAVGRALEQAGISFTAQVIGFDVAEGDRAQLQCLAEETGGSYLNASNASELGAALAIVAEEPPAPLPVPVTFTATNGDNGPVITDTLIWDLSGPDGNVFTGIQDQSADAVLPPGGSYRISALRTSDEVYSEATFTPSGGGMVVTLVFPVEVPQASLRGPATATIGSVIEVEWDGPDEDRDYVSVADPDEKTSYIRYGYTRSGNPTEVRMPDTPGSYELRYQLGEGGDIIARAAIEILDVEVALTAPDTASIGSVVEVSWIGPDEDRDYVSVADPDEKTSYVNYGYTRNGNPTEVRMPDTPGVYELRYQLGEGNKILATRTIEVTDVAVALTAPDTAPIGSTIEVAWVGPDEVRDYVSVADPDEKASYVHYGYTRNGNPTEVRMPDTPGVYELRYQLGEGGKILATRAIEITDVAVSLTAPESAPIGSLIEVSWIGPDEDRDYVSVADPREKTRYVAYGYTRNGNPAEVVMPDAPGTYELRYQLGEGGKILARRSIEITEVTATLAGPATAKVGAVIDVTWTGPGYDRDFIAVSDPKEKLRYVRYGYTRNGNPTEVRMPDAPGTYELRYQLGGSNKIIGRLAITVTE